MQLSLHNFAREIAILWGIYTTLNEKLRKFKITFKTVQRHQSPSSLVNVPPVVLERIKEIESPNESLLIKIFPPPSSSWLFLCLLPFCPLHN